MENDNHFSAARSRRASPARRSPPALEALLDKKSNSHWPDLKDTLHDLPEARPEAVARAKKLIADPDYPSPEQEAALARHFAAQFNADNDSLPS